MRWSQRETGVPYFFIVVFWLAWVGIPLMLALGWMGLLPEWFVR